MESRVSRPPLPASGHHSEAALAARRANLLKARAAPQARIYRPTEKRRAASRRNLAKAQAALRARRTSARLNALKHGLFAREFGAPAFRRLGENPREFQEMRRLFRRAFAPRERPERELVERLAETCWRRLRLLRAQARREQEALGAALASLPASRRPLTEEETEGRAHLLLSTLGTLPWNPEEELKLQSEIESLLRALLRKRSGGQLEFRRLSRRRDSRLVEVESLSLGGRALDALSDEELTERLRYLTPQRLHTMHRRQEQEEKKRETAALPAGP
jgi:hypothetical protein